MPNGAGGQPDKILIDRFLERGVSIARGEEGRRP